MSKHANCLTRPEAFISWGALWFLRRQKRTEPLSLLGSDGEHRHHASVDRNRIMAVPK